MSRDGLQELDCRSRVPNMRGAAVRDAATLAICRCVMANVHRCKRVSDLVIVWCLITHPHWRMGGKRQASEICIHSAWCRPGEPYAFDMGGGFVPFRRDVAYVSALRRRSSCRCSMQFDFVENRTALGL
jgi:hypothetical protein